MLSTASQSAVTLQVLRLTQLMLDGIRLIPWTLDDFCGTKSHLRVQHVLPRASRRYLKDLVAPDRLLLNGKRLGDQPVAV